MKNYLLGVMTVLIVALMSFKSVEDVFVVKPAKPKEIYVETLYGSSEVKEKIFQYSKKSFIVKSVVSVGSSGLYVLVMEKY